MNLSLSCDHRVVDGWDAASFVQEVRRLIDAPRCCSSTDLRGKGPQG